MGCPTDYSSPWDRWHTPGANVIHVMLHGPHGVSHGIHGVSDGIHGPCHEVHGLPHGLCHMPHGLTHGVHKAMVYAMETTTVYAMNMGWPMGLAMDTMRYAMDPVYPWDTLVLVFPWGGPWIN